LAPCLPLTGAREHCGTMSMVGEVELVRLNKSQAKAHQLAAGDEA
jgi:hypothetical protein